MSCGRIAFNLSTDPTDCIDLSGNGSDVPLQATPIIDGVLDHPFLGYTVGPGIVCDPDGLQVFPDRVRNYALAGLGAGSMPTIVADTGGSVPWGPRLDLLTTNEDPNWTQVLWVDTQFPGMNFTLEPGASAEVVIDYYTSVLNGPPAAAPFLTYPVWRFENSGPGIETITVAPSDDNQVVAFFPAGSPVGDFYIRSTQLRIETIGFAGASAVSTYLTGVGMGMTTHTDAF